jgi:hypothetical protein
MPMCCRPKIFNEKEMILFNLFKEYLRFLLVFHKLCYWTFVDSRSFCNILFLWLLSKVHISSSITHDTQWWKGKTNTRKFVTVFTGPPKTILVIKALIAFHSLTSGFHSVFLNSFRHIGQVIHRDFPLYVHTCLQSGRGQVVITIYLPTE